jgi:hypothetical protein
MCRTVSQYKPAAYRGDKISRDFLWFLARFQTAGSKLKTLRPFRGHAYSPATSRVPTTARFLLLGRARYKSDLDIEMRIFVGNNCFIFPFSVAAKNINRLFDASRRFHLNTNHKREPLRIAALSK